MYEPAPHPGWLCEPDIERLLERADDACRRATTWILDRQAADGSLGDPDNGFKYHRGPWALALMGHRGPGIALCDWVRRHLLVDGRLHGPARVLTDGWAYRDSVLMIGAHMLGQYDLSLGLVDSLVEWQDPVSGGFANDALDARSARGSDEMDLPYAAGPGFALLATGRIEEARRVAVFLENMMNAQEAADRRFYCFWSRSLQRPILESDPGFQERMVVDLHADRMQRWTFGGIAAGFLCRLYLADPRPGHLRLAERYQALSMWATEAQFHYPSACKSSWGAAMLLSVRGRDEYRRWCVRMTDWYVRNQRSDGTWQPWVERTESDVIEITLEFIQHLDLLSSTLRTARSVDARPS